MVQIRFKGESSAWHRSDFFFLLIYYNNSPSWSCNANFDAETRTKVRTMSDGTETYLVLSSLKDLAT